MFVYIIYIIYICTVAMKQQPNTPSYDDFRNIKSEINR